ncbi:MAG: cbb3-type cytochrome oxidase assembly protein CcoS [Gammaproteobacteria bacterium]|nr:cbb3-type cytochrome oxidase assembly protein CcoS [Gammaproteobacteria bacterium]
MESLYLLVPVALVFLVIAVRVLFWAVNSGQYDDLDTEGQRILFDDGPGARRGRKRAPASRAGESGERESAPSSSPDLPDSALPSAAAAASGPADNQAVPKNDQAAATAPAGLKPGSTTSAPAGPSAGQARDQ